MKKILIFGLARSGTTVLQKYLARSLKLKSYSEPFSDTEYRKQIGDPYQWAANLPHAVIKVLAQNLDYVDLLQLINKGDFDSIVVTKRTNLADLCVSLYYAEQITRKYHYTSRPESITPFTVPKDFIDGFLVPYRWYCDTIQKLNNLKIPYTVFDYDQYQLDKSQTINGVEFCLDKEVDYGIDTVASNINYSQVCLNYKEIESILKNENNR
jgi:hypothetical protein